MLLAARIIAEPFHCPGSVALHPRRIQSSSYPVMGPAAHASQYARNSWRLDRGSPQVRQLSGIVMLVPIGGAVGSIFADRRVMLGTSEPPVIVLRMWNLTNTSVVRGLASAAAVSMDHEPADVATRMDLVGEILRVLLCAAPGAALGTLVFLTIALFAGWSVWIMESQPEPFLVL